MEGAKMEGRKTERVETEGLKTEGLEMEGLEMERLKMEGLELERLKTDTVPQGRRPEEPERGRFRFDNAEVRRRDRLLDEEAARELLRRGEYGVLSMVAEQGEAYGIPLSYVWDGDGCIYVHCATEGRKLRCVDRAPEVSFCVVGATRVAPSKFTTAYESVVVRARAVRGIPVEERWRALRLLLEKYAPDECETGLHYAERSFARTEILRLEILAVSAKCKRVK